MRLQGGDVVYACTINSSSKIDKHTLPFIYVTNNEYQATGLNIISYSMSGNATEVVSMSKMQRKGRLL